MEDLAAMKYITQVEDKTFAIEVQNGAIVVDGQMHCVDLRHIEPLSLYSLLIDNLSHEILIEEQEGRYGAMLQGQLYDVDVQEERLCADRISCPESPSSSKPTQVAAPMPGLVLDVLVDTGQTTRSGDVVVTLESMKMRTELHSPRDGVVRAVHVAPGEHVSHGQLLVTVSPEQSA
jgi:pyruvate carboxylase subunit B